MVNIPLKIEDKGSFNKFVRNEERKDKEEC